MTFDRVTAVVVMISCKVSTVRIAGACNQIQMLHCRTQHLERVARSERFQQTTEPQR